MVYKLIINLKTYKESSNKNAIKIAKICSDLKAYAKKRDVEIILCVQSVDLKDVVALGVKVYSQHLDVLNYGANTGFIVGSVLKDIKVSGSLISHSEHILDLDNIKERIDICRKLGFESCVCARDVKAVKKIAKLNPDFIAVEPKELIGGDISISSAKPELIKKSVVAVDSIPLLVGAGVKTGVDVRKGVELGAKGILVASGVVKAKDVKAAIVDLIDGFEL